MASGATQRNGITATSWQTLLVEASNRTEAQAGSANHSALLSHGTGARFRSTREPAALTRDPANFQTLNPQKQQPTANPTRPAAHSEACVLRLKQISKMNGYVSTASNDPALDRA